MVKPFAGADLSSHVHGESTGTIFGPEGKPRAGAFFMSNDMITELESESYKGQYELFKTYVDNAIVAGHLPEDSTKGAVRQPNNVRALCTGDWKIVHYVDPNGVESDEWELYCLRTDPIEQTNLVDFRTGEVRDNVSVSGLTTYELRLKNTQLRTELAKQEASILGTSS